MKFKPVLIRKFPKCPNCDQGYLKYAYTSPMPDEKGNFDTEAREVYACTLCQSEYKLEGE